VTILMRDDAAALLVYGEAHAAPLRHLAKALEGDDEMFKALAADDANALAVEDTAPKHPDISCRTCGKVGTPNQIRRHYRATGHGDPPQPERVPNEQVASNPDADYLAKVLGDADSSVERLEVVRRLAKGGRS
jgi:hypothetical protein